MKQRTNLEQVTEFCDSVLSKTVPSCLMVQKAVERWQADLAREDLYFDEKAFNRFVRFAREFKHFKGPMAGTHFAPEPWQLFVMANLIGLKRKETGLRKYTYADIYVPRKNGKTFMAAIFAAYFLLKDGEAGPEVYTAAVDQAQARLVGNQTVGLIRDGGQQIREDIRPGGRAHIVAVDLMGHHKAVHVRADGGAEAGVVLPDVVGGVVPLDPEVHRGELAPADAAQL